MVSSLRAKLSLVFAFVILLSLLLSGSAFVMLVRGYQTQLAAERLADLAMPMSFQARLLDRSGVSASSIVTYMQAQADEMGVRLLLIDANGTTIEDTQSSLKGTQFDIHHNSRIVSKMGQVVYAGWASTPGNDALYYVAIPPDTNRPPPGGDLYPARTMPYTVVVAVPEQSLGGAWMSIAPFLSVAAISSLVVSVLIAYFLARSITRPLVELTHASEAMAKGQYDHNIVAHGNDEVARLAQSFNEMAHQVGQTHQTLREFLANASHELKTPLTSIQGFSQAMIDGAVTEPEDYAKAAAIVYAESERMRKLVDDLLLLSRMETGQVAMEQRVLDMKELMATCLERFEWYAEKKQIELELSADGAIPGVLGDSGRLEQVFGNLLDNAIRYSPDGSRVTAKVESVRAEASAVEGLASRDLTPEHSAGQNWVRITVHNTGSWIREDELQRVFERFYRSNRNGDRPSDGAGLGLAIVREIVCSHGGWVVARSAQASGTEFEVNLPAAAPKPENRAASGKRRAGVLNNLAHLSGRGNDSKASAGKPDNAGQGNRS